MRSMTSCSRFSPIRLPSWIRHATLNYQLRAFSSVSAAPTIKYPWIDSRGVYQSWSDNSFCASPLRTGNELRVFNPATQELIGTVHETTESNFNEIMVKAERAAKEWRLVPVSQRQRVMLRYQALLRQHIDELAMLVTLENGKTLTDAVGDVVRGIEVVESACNIAPYLVGDALRGVSSNGMDTISYRQPLGVCAGICPFNFPAMIPLWMFPLAIAAGNAFVLKPSDKTPGCALRLAELCAEAGLPPNVLQLVHGARGVVQQICTHEQIKAISFVGGNAAGEYIAETGSRHGKRVQANMGAKNHAVILTSDYRYTDRSAVVKAIVGAAFGAAGQRCMALSTVILVVESSSSSREGEEEEVERDWMNDLVAQASKLKVGAGWDATTDVGPLISMASRQRVESLVNDAIDQGMAEVHLDGRSFTVPNYPHGNFVGPTILKLGHSTTSATTINSSNHSKNVCTEEIFGPVLTVVTARSLDEAIAMVNANKYGNGCALFTTSGAAARKFTADIECGQVGINVPIPVPLPMFSFTGNKASMRGDLNFYGSAGVHFYTQLQTVTSHWPFTSGTDLGGVTMPIGEALVPAESQR